MRFNKPVTNTINFGGDRAFNLPIDLELYSLICTSMLSGTFYTPNTNDLLNRIKSRIRKVDPEYVAKLAIYARENMYLRSIPMVLAVELAKIHKGDSLVRKLVSRIVQRADEITELLAYYVKANSRSNENKSKIRSDMYEIPKVLFGLSKQIQKGLAQSFTKFDEYQFAKYNRDAEIKLRDAMRITHPRPLNDEMSSLFKKILTNTLSTPYTWETELSKAGQESRNKKEVWEELIDSRKVGYMAVLRNLRNILQADVSEGHIEKVAQYISNTKAIEVSKQLPFRFLSAYRVLVGEPIRRWSGDDRKEELPSSQKLSIILEALEDAVKTSVKNIPMFMNENVLIATDVSGSMQCSVSSKSVVQNFDIGTMLAMLLRHKCATATAGMFGDTWKVVNFPGDNILYNANEIHKREGEVGYSTNGWKVLDWACKSSERYDRIMIFTDCQLWDSTGAHQGRGAMNKFWTIYKEKNPNSKLYLFNLQPYGTSPIDLLDKNVSLISGWSDKIFNVLDGIEKGKEALEEINKIEL